MTPLWFSGELQRLMAAFGKSSGMSQTQIDSWWNELEGPSHDDTRTAVDRLLKDPNIKGFPTLAHLARHLPKHRTLRATGIWWDPHTGSWGMANGTSRTVMALEFIDQDERERMARYTLGLGPLRNDREPTQDQIEFAEMLTPGIFDRWMQERKVAADERAAAQAVGL